MIVLFVDGGTFDDNPGSAIYYSVVAKNGSGYDRWIYRKRNDNYKTANQSEYVAIINALDQVLERGLNGEQIHIHSDSKVMVNQVNGKWRVRDETLRNLYGQVHERLSTISSPVHIQWTPREEIYKVVGH